MNKIIGLLNKNQQQNMSYDPIMDAENNPAASLEDYSNLISEDPTLLQTAKPPQDYMPKALEERDDMAVASTPQTQTPNAPVIGSTKDIVPPPTGETDLQKLEAKLQELRGLDVARQETASKYNFGAKAAAIIGDAISKYQSGAIQKNVGVPIQHTGPSLQQLMGIIGEVKPTSTAEQRQTLVDRYKELKSEQKEAGVTKRAKEEADLKYKRDLAMLDRKLAADKEVAGMKLAKEAAKINEKPTVGEQTVDREFAKKFNEWRTGGKADYEENKKIFDEAITALNTGKISTGFTEGIGAKTPGIRTDTKQLETRVRKALNSMLRATLGAQFTQEEGERIFQQTFDPFATPDENKKNMATELSKIEKRARDIESQGQYFTKQKTLSGFMNEPIKEAYSNEEQEALDWANKNPNNPKAIEIKNELKR